MGESLVDRAVRDAGGMDALVDRLGVKRVIELTNTWEAIARPEQILPSGDWDTWFIRSGRGWGKLLSLITPIPTPSGWSRLGDLAVGDEVFDEAGRRCRILVTFDATPEVAYRVKFSDGTHVDACSEHQWVTWTHAERKAYLRSPYEPKGRFPENWPQWRLRRFKNGGQLPAAVIARARALLASGLSMRRVAAKMGRSRQSLMRHVEGAYAEREPAVDLDSPGPQIRATQELFETQTHGKRGDRNHCVPVCGSLDLPNADLPIKPYVLGVWLGDGDSAGACLTCSDRDVELLGHLREEGLRVIANAPGAEGKAPRYSLGGAPTRRNRKTGRMMGTDSLHTKLRVCGLIRNKHVPPAYLRGSQRQRLALLQGLMDTDGYVDPDTGKVEFCNTNKALVDAVVELARSLGQKPVASESRAMLYGRDCGPKWRVTWRPTVPVFRMARKAALIRPADGSHGLRNCHRMITDIVPIAPVPMRCLTVDSPNSMFLCGDGMIPTHNTRTGAQATIAIAEEATRLIEQGTLAQEEAMIYIVGATAADVRDVMVKGPAGILRCASPWSPAVYEPSRRRIVWPSGVHAMLFTAEEPDRLRGPQGIFAWCDELPAWKYPDDAWDNLQFGLRLGPNPRAVVTATPRPTQIVKDILKAAGTIVTIGHTSDNAKNLSPKALAKLIARYGGTRIGRQEMGGEVLDDNPNALWRMADIDRLRLKPRPGQVLPADPGWSEKDDAADFKKLMAALAPRAARQLAIVEANGIELERIMIGVDPAVSNNPNSDETGIVVVGVGVCRCRGEEQVHGFVLEDVSGTYSPGEWGALLVRLFEVWRANKIIAEINNGGALVEANLRATDGGAGLPYDGVHAKRGKLVRAEPISTLTEQSKFHHVGSFPKLEDELTGWDPMDPSAKSPNRLDAMVYATSELMLDSATVTYSKPTRMGPPRRI